MDKQYKERVQAWLDKNRQKVSVLFSQFGVQENPTLPMLLALYKDPEYGKDFLHALALIPDFPALIVKIEGDTTLNKVSTGLNALGDLLGVFSDDSVQTITPQPPPPPPAPESTWTTKKILIIGGIIVVVLIVIVVVVKKFKKQ